MRDVVIFMDKSKSIDRPSRIRVAHILDALKHAPGNCFHEMSYIQHLLQKTHSSFSVQELGRSMTCWQVADVSGCAQSGNPPVTRLA